MRRNHHFTPGVLAVAEGEKQAATVVAFSIGAQRERAAPQPRQRHQHSNQVAEFSQTLEVAIGQCSHVGGEAHVESVDVKERTSRVVQANDVTRTPPARENRLDRIVRPAFGEVAEEGIAGPKRKKPERRASSRISSGKKPVYDFKARAVSSDSDEIAIAFRIGAVRKHSSFTGNTPGAPSRSTPMRTRAPRIASKSMIWPRSAR